MPAEAPPPVRLGARLRAVAEQVPPGARVADVGTDHAYLLAWLRHAGRIVGGIGIDVVEGPLAQARRTLDALESTGLELRRGDGLQPLAPGEVDAVVLAGMGGSREIGLCEAAPAVLDRLRRLVLQPNTEWVAVRRWIARRRFGLVEERMTWERGKPYVVFAIDPRAGEEPGWSEDELELGPRLLEERSPAFVRWLREELRRTERALAGAAASTRAEAAPPHELLARRARLQRALGADLAPRVER